MMSKIKHVISFLLGALYALAIVGSCALPASSLRAICYVVLAFESTFLFALVFVTLLENWNKE